MRYDRIRFNSLSCTVLLLISMLFTNMVRGELQGFVQNCTLDVVDTAGSDLFLSFEEFASYMTTLCREMKSCHSGEEVEFSSLPVSLQIQFVLSSSSCRAPTWQCTENYGQEDIGLHLTNTSSPTNMTEIVEHFCLDIHPYVLQFLSPSSYTPTATPTHQISKSPSKAPNSNLQPIQNRDSDNFPLVIGVLVISFVVISSILGLLFYQKRKKKSLSVDKETYNINSPKTDTTSPLSSPTSQDQQQHENIILSLPVKDNKSCETSEPSMGPVSNENSNSSTSSTIPNLINSTGKGNLFLQSDSYDGDFFSSSDDENQVYHTQSTPSIIIETQSYQSESSSSTATPQSIWTPPPKKKIWYPFRRKISGTSFNESRNVDIQNELALQEDSSVSSWSNGSSPNATFLHENELQSSPVNSNKSDDESESMSNEDSFDNNTRETSSDGSTKTFMDELDRAIESGDWNTVQAQAALMLDVGDRQSHSISSFTKDSSLTQIDIENIVDAGNWKGTVTPLKDSESAQSSSVSVITDDFHSCHGNE